MNIELLSPLSPSSPSAATTTVQHFTTWENPYISKCRALEAHIIVNTSGEIENNDISRVGIVCNNTNGTIVELGSGSGQHMIELARSFPDKAIFGFELRYKRAVRTIEKSIKAEINNAYVLRTSALNLQKIFQPGSVEQLYMNFPDPWAKKTRWKKHRFLNKETLTMIGTTLALGGMFQYKSDHQESFNELLSLLQDNELLQLHAHTNDLHRSTFVAENITTEFEQLFLSQNLPIYWLEAYRI
jgi:tRNA (guanine-N7-)-methyltransferase